MADEHTDAAPVDGPVETPVEETAASTPVEEGSTQDTPETAEDGTDSPAPEPTKEKGGYQKRINEITRAKHEERRAKEAAEMQVRELKERIARLEGAALVPQKPRFEDYDTPEDFETAFEAYITAKAQYPAPETSAPSTEQASESVPPEVNQAGTKVSAQGAALYGADAFAQSVAPAVEAGVFTPEVQLALAKLETGAQIAYTLGQDAEAAAAVLMSADNPVALARVLGRIEARIEAGGAPAVPVKEPVTTPTPTKTSTIDPPIKPVTGGTASAESGSPRDSDDDDTWFRKREEQLRNKRRST